MGSEIYLVDGQRKVNQKGVTRIDHLCSEPRSFTPVAHLYPGNEAYRALF